MSHLVSLSRLSPVGLAILTALFLLAAVLHAQDGKPPAPALKPTEVQSLRLQVKQRDALLAKAALEQAQRAFQQALTDLTAESERVKAENGWPKDTQFDPNTTQFSPAPTLSDGPHGPIPPKEKKP